jgi:ferrochelatase
MKKAVLLVNLGTPLQPTKKEVSRFLTQFLNDPYVIDIPWVFRKLLVNLIIVPFRAAKSTKMYQKLWTTEGSPIFYHLNQLGHKLQKEIGSEMQVFTAMRYGSPDFRSTLESIADAKIEQLFVLPLFPQYATSTSGSIIHLVQKEMKRMYNPFQISIIQDFFNHPDFIQSFTQKINSHQPECFDHLIFSYHSLPERQLEKLHPEYKCELCNCDNEMPEYGKNCYKAQCYETTRLLVRSLQLRPSDYSVTFQSRFAKKWIGPFTEDIIKKLANDGKKRVLVVSPSFVADCLETLVEIKQDYAELFKSNGGEELVLVESLNSDKIWVKAIANIVL